MTLIRLTIFISLLFIRALLADQMPGVANLTMVVSLSSDGNYAFSTNTNQQGILWDIKDKTYKVIAQNVNIYSAYFIKKTNDFIYQDNKTNDVIVENVNGKIIKHFNPGFASYGEVMTADLRTWIASDEEYQLFKITDNQKQQFFYYWDGPNFVHETPPPKGKPYGGEDFEGVGKLFNLSFSPDEKTLLSSGMDEFYLWDVATTKLIRHEEKNIGKATSIFNPNGNHIFSSDEDYWLYYYNINHQTGIKSKFWPSGDAMTQYQNADQNDTTGIISSKFIDDKDVLIFMVGVPDDFNYAVLIDPAGAVCLNHPDANGFICKTYPKEFLPLIAKANTDFNYRKTWPMLSDDYSRDEVIDTSPSAHILVIAMNAANGILVYKYDPQTQTLKQIWAPEVTWLNKL